MKLKKHIKSLIPNFILRAIAGNLSSAEEKALLEIPKRQCNPASLHRSSKVLRDSIIRSDKTEKAWLEAEQILSQYEIPDLTGGVNFGDRRALFYLIQYFSPDSVLEIGTHIGASTIHMACAMKNSEGARALSKSLTSVDIVDVNDVNLKPWLNYGAKQSPAESIRSLGFENWVDFRVSNSINYLKNGNFGFDFIFLDGDHSASTVYLEVPLALERLNKGGVILLHDYFPNGEKIWEEQKAIEGPYLAVKRLISEGAQISTLPLGKLPWETKFGSHATSLALLLRRD